MKKTKSKQLRPIELQAVLQTANAEKGESIVDLWIAVQRAYGGNNREAYYAALDKYLAV